MIEISVNARCAPGDIAVVLREEASRLSADGYGVGGSDEYVYELPSDDPGVDTHDILDQVSAGSFGGGTVRFHDMELRHPGHERCASLWAVYDTESREFVEWINTLTFRTAEDLREYLEDVVSKDIPG